ncbi:SAM-dependent methlyltransferase [Skermanella stibiiresistens SB22]|uniref:SAM-dependent methlyltransferase n=1 Tax=Skermanella stibiiresistens SB22 TaxID=1385369 RepID=W9H880_9PROT|nr:methyltransferase domain-containing protein [Skermanella stibiiresistens]EWY40897.1 SAM-dependent methlyltransferase [Skermanella stibiiresistens SB22]
MTFPKLSRPVAGGCGGDATPWQEQWSDRARFIRSWITEPSRVAAVVPSSASLARLITSEIGAAQSPVLELGPGTGVFTKALLDRGLDQADLTLVEFGVEFVTVLRERFPRARILHQDASRLSALDLFPEAAAGAVVSGLGLLSMPPRTVIAILTSAFACLRPHGAFYQFTYGPRCPVARPILDRLGLKARRIGGTVSNLPPAAVYRISRRGPHRPGWRSPSP